MSLDNLSLLSIRPIATDVLKPEGGSEEFSERKLDKTRIVQSS